MTESKTDILLLMLMGIVILLMVAVVGLFLRMNQLQREVLAALTPLQAGAMEQDMGLEIGTKAPDFGLSDTNGATVLLEDYAGQRVLLTFSSTHCPACEGMYSHLRAFSESQENVQVVMISQGSAEENRQLVQAQGFAFPVLTTPGWNDKVMVDYQVPGTPFSYVIDEEGMIVNAGFANTQRQLRTLVKGSEE